MEIPNIFKYDRSLFPAKAVFFYNTKHGAVEPLKAEVSEIRGQKAGFAEAFNDNSTLKNTSPQTLAASNILKLEECYVPSGIEHIFVKFSMRVEPNSIKPTACSNQDVHDLMTEFSKEFANKGGYKELAKRYVKNLLLGTWLWRNQNTGVTEVEVKSTTGNTFKIDNTRELDWHSQWPAKALKVQEALTDELTQGLTDPKLYLGWEVTAKLSVMFCQEVFPSQILKVETGEGEASKQFAKVEFADGKQGVCFSKGKVAAALQMIDDWYTEDAEKRLRIHEYGADLDFSIARRAPGDGNSFYEIVVNIESIIEELKAGKMTGEALYIAAVLIKGGMMQKKGAKS